MPPHRVLIADPTATDRIAVGHWVRRRFGSRVVVGSGDGLETMTLAGQLRPDLVVVDLTLPGVDGLVAVQRLRAQLPEAHIVAVSGAGEAHVGHLAIAAGADAFVEKAPGLEDVLGAIDDLCGMVPVTGALGDGTAPSPTAAGWPSDGQREVLEALEEGVLVVDPHGRVLTANRAAALTLGRSMGALLGASTRSVFAGALRSDGRQAPHGEDDPVRGVLLTARPVTGLVTGLVRPDGRTVWLSVDVRPLDSEPTPRRVVVTLRDLSEARHLRTQLAGADARLGAVLERVPDPLALLAAERDAAGEVLAFRVVARSEAAGRRLPWVVGEQVAGTGGGTGPELFDHLVAMLARPVGEEADHWLGNAPGEGGSLRLETLGPDEVLVTVAEPDVADLLEAALDSGPVGIALLDHTGRAVVLNTVADRLLAGWPLVGAPVGAGRTVRRVETGRPMEAGDLDIERLLQGDTIQVPELMTVDEHGQETYLLVSGSPVRDAAQRVTGAVVTVLDNTARHLAEVALAATHADLERSNTDLREFTAVASHDLAQPLQVVAGYAELLAESPGVAVDENAAALVQRIRAGVDRMQALINDLLTYSQVVTPSSRAFARVELAEALAEVVELFSDQISDSGATVEARELPAVHADRPQVLQLLQNLLGNALKYVEPGTAPVVVVSARPAERRPGANDTTVPGASEPEQWELSVSDQGIGIAPEQREAAFTMFQRLVDRGDYEGTGIGLAVCRRIVERHGGRIWIEEAPGGGTRVSCTLPAAGPPHRHGPGSGE